MTSTITAIAFLVLQIIHAQEFTGKAVYKTSSKSSFKISLENNSRMDDKMQEELQKRIQKMNQKTFILAFNKYSSTYKQEVILSAPKLQVGGMKTVVMNLGGSNSADVYYKNVQENRFANQTEIMGKRFLVKDNLISFNWELSSETKNIGAYTCYKATFSKEVETKNTAFKDDESTEEIEKETIITTAWYTPQISVSNGLGNYQGLPGLILEINDGKKIIVCTEIVLNPSKQSSIEAPKKGKVVSQKKFLEIQKQKSDEMIEKFKTRKGLDLGNGLNIKIGG
jgi:GLPGLI family protein